MKLMPFFVLCLVFSIPLLAILSKSDIGQAIADAIRHNSGANEGAAVRQELEQMRADVEQLRSELDGVHAELGEAHERLEFAERLLASRGTAELPPVGGQT
ncbi:MAG TPA: hypothetical protein VGM77_08105 [Gemmatimonadales bacterium]|jgi:multidrug resistance efflux pump